MVGIFGAWEGCSNFYLWEILPGEGCLHMHTVPTPCHLLPQNPLFTWGWEGQGLPPSDGRHDLFLPFTLYVYLIKALWTSCWCFFFLLLLMVLHKNHTPSQTKQLWSFIIWMGQEEKGRNKKEKDFGNFLLLCYYWLGAGSLLEAADLLLTQPDPCGQQALQHELPCCQCPPRRPAFFSSPAMFHYAK